MAEPELMPPPSNSFNVEGSLEQQENKENPTLPKDISKDENEPNHPRSQDVLPSTPATRLPLADLIGDSEIPKNPIINASPQEQIQWNIVTTPLDHKRKKTSARSTRSKKRARSSSPPSATSAARPKDANPLLDLQGLKQSLNTPQANPATNLWTRYSHVGMMTSKHGTLEPRTGSLPQPASSSHSADDQTGNVAGLRRWTSCGTEWPSSKKKRRKMFHPMSLGQIDETFDDIPKSGIDRHAAKARSDRIKSLLQGVQEGLSRTEDADDLFIDDKGPSSSSPLPDRIEEFDRSSISPCRPQELPSRAGKVSTQEGAQQNTTSEMGSNSNNARQPKSSRFGTDSFEDEMSHIALPDVSRHTAETVTATKVSPEGELKGSTQEEQPPTPIVSKWNIRNSSPDKKPSDHDGDEADDEFGDNEMFSGDDFDIVASMCDHGRTQPSASTETNAVSQTPNPNAAMNALEEEDFGDVDIDEESFAAIEASTTQTAASSGESKLPKRRQNNGAIQRYLVKNVHEEIYNSSAISQNQPEKVLIVEEENTKVNRFVRLRGSWIDTRCTNGSFVHIIGEFNRGTCIIDDAQGMLILHPDHLISALVVADSFGCLRKAVLQDRVKATSESSEPQVYGTILHELFQEALAANRWDDAWLDATIEALAEKHLEDLYAIRVDTKHAIGHLQSKKPALTSWARTFVKAEPSANAFVNDRHGKQVTMSVNKLLDVEEHIWSPMYGLKGNIDASVQVNMQDEEGSRTLAVPFEVKTGKNSNSPSHRAQTALYTLLLSDRYDVAVAYGILYYLERSEISRVPAIRHELRHMVMQRNELACYVRERLSLPPMLKQTHTCDRCYAKTPCFLYHKLVEDGDGETSGMRAKFDAMTKHLSLVHQSFFKKWDDLITKEESEMMKFRRELWTMLSNEREKLGRCFANVVLESDCGMEEHKASKINKFQYTFRKLEESPGFSFNDSQISVGEPIVVSDEKGHYALAKGYVTSVQKKYIDVAVDRRLRNARKRLSGFDEDTNQDFTGIMTVGQDAHLAHGTVNDAEPSRFRLDKDEFSNGMATVRNNLVQLMNNDCFRSRELRELVVDGKAPEVKTSIHPYTISGPASQADINADQRAAIEKIMTAKEYALVLGMPGTGKTTTIAHIIRALVSDGKSVLLTSFTHTAVDNILLKIKHDNVDILRLGATSKVHPEVREFAALAESPKNSVEELRSAYHDPKVVATTCLGIGHQVFKERVFDYCIVDEASQITLPVCLGPIRMAKTFVLVGDHYQLPPLVKNRDAQEGGLDVSLFKLLSETQPQAVVTLHHQYRMNEECMKLANELIYDGKLVCGSESIARRRLELPQWQRAMESLHRSGQGTSSSMDRPSSRRPPGSSPAKAQTVQPLESKASTKRTHCTNHPANNPDPPCWLHRTLSPQSPPVIFLNTDAIHPLKSLESSKGSRITNTTEATLVSQLVRALLASGAPSSSVGVITLYRSQLAVIQGLLGLQGASSRKNTATATDAGIAEVEAHTADRFQGRDKDVVVLSCVRSNNLDGSHAPITTEHPNDSNNKTKISDTATKPIVGDLLKDWRRVNVALTRARKKMVIVGSAETLRRGDALLARMVGLCEREGWIVECPPGCSDGGLGACAEEAHDWGALSTLNLGSQRAGEEPRDVASHAQSTQPQQQRPRQPLAPRPANTLNAEANKPYKQPRPVVKSGKLEVLRRQRGGGSVGVREAVVAEVLGDVYAD